MEDYTKITFEEFYKKYIAINKNKLVTVESDLEFFQQIDKAQKEGKYIALHKGRTTNYNCYIQSLYNLVVALQTKKKVLLVSLKPKNVIDDIKKYFGINVVYTQAMKNRSPVNGNYHLKIIK